MRMRAPRSSRRARSARRPKRISTAAQVAFENAKPIFERNEQQMRKAVISAQTFDTAKAAYDAARTRLDVAARALEVARASVAVAERNLEDTVVRAPFAGVVTVKAAQAGEIVSPISAGGGFTRTGIGTIVDMDSLEVEVDVERELHQSRAARSSRATAKLNAYPDWEIPAHVIAIIPTADRSQGHREGARRASSEQDPRILPDMGVRVRSSRTPKRAQRRAAGAGVRARASCRSDAVQANGDTGVVFVRQRRQPSSGACVQLGSARRRRASRAVGTSRRARSVAVGDLLDSSRDGAKVRRRANERASRARRIEGEGR